MSKLPTLEKIKEGIRYQTALQNVTAQSNGDSKALHNAMAVVPEGEMWRMVQWLHEIILPKVAEFRGVDSVEYKNYCTVRDSVIWSMYVMQMHERLLQGVGRNKQMLDFFRERAVFYENELLKYTTAEQLLQGEALQAYRVGIVANALSLLEENKK
jgi:hypothetical protein